MSASKKKLSRREMLRLMGAGAAGLAGSSILTACAPTEPETIKETVVVKETVETEVEVPVEVEKVVTATPPPPEPVTLRVATYGFQPWLILLEGMNNEYMEKYPNVTLKLESAPWGEFWQKLEAQAIAGDPPDVSVVENWRVPYGMKGYLLELKPVLDTVDTSIFFDSVTCASLINTAKLTCGCTANGDMMWSFPANGTCMVTYLNLDLLEAAGLDYPDEDWDWNAFREYAIQLTLDENGKHPGEPGFDRDKRVQYGIDETLFEPSAVKSFIWRNNGYVWQPPFDKPDCCLLQSDEVLETLHYLNDLHELGVAATGGEFAGISRPFTTGQVGMHNEGSWNVDTWVRDITKFGFDIQRLPVGPAGKEFRKSTTDWGNDWGIFKETEELEASIELLKYYVMREEGSAWFGTAGIPTVKAAAEEPAWLDFPDGAHLPPHREVMINAMDEIPGVPTGYYERDKIMATYYALEDLRLGLVTPEEMVANCCEVINELCIREK